MSKPFSTEAEMCSRFIEALPRGWTAFAETEGWDILLVRDVDGFQIGIQAKLRLNAEVLTQALEERGTWAIESPGPDCRAVLVPDGGGLSRVCAYIGLTVITVYPDRNQNGGRYCTVFSPNLPGDRYHDEYWHEWLPAKRHRLPEYVPDVQAGASSPVQLTDWKIAAIKLLIILERRGFVTRSDFKHLHMDHRRWIAAESGWLLVRDGRFVAGPRLPALQAIHPRNWAQIEADAEKWMPKNIPTPMVQASMEFPR